ncbi:D-alanine--D-alanine ligase [Candidatus Poribacteria bacterium]|nr:MAG: D-alanine--D-alanine ligase [Candidatus Poribacteria bacterium]
MRVDEVRRRLKGKRIAVLMGGTSGERAVSLRSGRNVLNALRRQGLEAEGLDPADPDFVERLMRGGFDIAFIALHGRGGEDGTIQGLLEVLGIPYTGSGVLASALAMNKVAAKRIFLSTGVPTPKFATIDPGGDIELQCQEAVELLGLPIVVKPTSEGSSLGVTIVRSAEDLPAVVRKTIAEYRDVFLEEFIPGREVTVGVLGTGDEAWALPILELRPKKEFYDYEAKYTPGMTEFVIPAPFPREVEERIVEAALGAHRSLGCRDLSRVDMRVHPERGPFVTDVNTIPGLTDLSDLPAQAEAAGISYDELILIILGSALERR